MRYIKFTGGTGYCGCDFEEVEAFPDSASDIFLDAVAVNKAHDNAVSLEHCATGGIDEDFETEEDREAYYADAYCHWEEISEEDYRELKEEGL